MHVYALSCMSVCTCMFAGVPDQMVDAVSLLRDRAESDEANVLYSLVNDLSKVWRLHIIPLLHDRRKQGGM